MRTLFSLVIVSILFITPALIAECTTIQDGTLLTSANEPITTGYDEWGYNYQAHMFNGTYCGAYRNAQWCLDAGYADVELKMKWNDAWLSNMDCDEDGLLDRHFGYPTYVGSGAWLTNHQAGTYEEYDLDKGRNVEYHWTYFVKIVAVPADAYQEGNYWYEANGDEIGEVIWGDFAVVQRVYNDQGSGQHGIEYVSEYTPGFGVYKPHVDQVTHED